jgi:hypothetical protein
MASLLFLLVVPATLDKRALLLNSSLRHNLFVERLLYVRHDGATRPR